MANARIDITDHAVLRYVQRHARGLSHARARADIEHLVGKAAPLKKRTIGGQQLWRVEDPPMLLVIKPDGGRCVCVTILPPEPEEGTAADAAADAEIVGAYERIRHLVERGTRATTETKAVRGDVDSLCAKLRERIDSLKSARETLKRDLRAIHAAAIGDVPTGAGLQAPSPRVDQQHPAESSEKGAEKHATDILRMQIAATERRYEKQLAHGRRMSADRDRARLLLAVAMRGLAQSGDPETRAVFASIVEAEPWTGVSSYWDRVIVLRPQDEAPAFDASDEVKR